MHSLQEWDTTLIAHDEKDNVGSDDHDEVDVENENHNNKLTKLGRCDS